MSRPRARWAAGGLVAVALAGAGCGSSQELPPPPEPGKAPALREKPVGQVMRVGNKPEGLAFDPVTGLAAVAVRDPAALVLVDTRRRRIVRRVPLPAPARHLSLERPGGPVLVPVEKADSLVRVSLPDGRRRVTRVGRQPHDVTAVSGRVFVGNELGNTVSVIEDDRVIRTLPAPANPGGLAAPTSDRVAALGVRGRQVELWDSRSLRSVGRLDAGVGPTHTVSDGRGHLVVADTQGDAVLLLRADSKLSLICRTNVSGKPYGLAIDLRRNRLWVGLTELNRVVELELRGGKRPVTVTSYPTVRQPNTLAVDPRTGRVLVAGSADGTLEVFEPSR